MMTMHNSFSQRKLLLVIPLLMLLSACDRDSVDDHDHFVSVDRVEVYDWSSGEIYAYWQSGMNSFETSAMPTLEVEEDLSLGVAFLDYRGNEPDLGDEFILNAWTSAEDTGETINLDVRTDHVVISGLSAGTAHVIFDLVHGNHSDFTSVALPIEVVAALPPR